jgi:hypothetical protein
MGEFIGDQYNDKDCRKEQYIPDTGKKSDVLPNFREEIYIHVRYRDRKVFVHVVDHVVDHEFGHDNSECKKHKIEP